MRLETRTLPLALLLAGIGRRVYLRGFHRVARWCFPHEEQAGVELPIELEGLRYVGRGDNYIDWMAFFYGAYERYLLDFIVERLRGRAQGVFLDVGANEGHHSLYMAAHARAVHAFEPYPPLVARIREKIAANGLANLHVHPVALGDRSAELRFFPPLGSNAGRGSFVSRQGGGCADAVTLPVAMGDDYLERAGITHVDIAKIDVEGYEPQVLRGLRRTFARCRPAIVVELNELNKRAFSSVHSLAAHLPPDYALFALVLRGSIALRPSLVPLSRPVLERFVGNAVCLPAERE